jgi:hypothetical protein
MTNMLGGGDSAHNRRVVDVEGPGDPVKLSPLMCRLRATSRIWWGVSAREENLATNDVWRSRWTVYDDEIANCALQAQRKELLIGG